MCEWLAAWGPVAYGTIVLLAVAFAVSMYWLYAVVRYAAAIRARKE